MSQLFRIATSAEKDVNKTSFSIETTSIHCKWQEVAAEISNSKSYVVADGPIWGISWFFLQQYEEFTESGEFPRFRSFF